MVCDTHLKQRDYPPGNRLNGWEHCCLQDSKIKAWKNKPLLAVQRQCTCHHIQSKHHFFLSETSEVIKVHPSTYKQRPDFKGSLWAGFPSSPDVFVPMALCATVLCTHSPTASTVHLQRCRSSTSGSRGSSGDTGHNTKQLRGSQGTNTLIPGGPLSVRLLSHRSASKSAGLPRTVVPLPLRSRCNISGLHGEVQHDG